MARSCGHGRSQYYLALLREELGVEPGPPRTPDHAATHCWALRNQPQGDLSPSRTASPLGAVAATGMSFENSIVDASILRPDFTRSGRLFDDDEVVVESL